MVTGVAQAWARTGHQEPLERRWDAAVERLRKLSPGQSVGGPRSELGLDQIEAEIARLTKPVNVDDPALHAATAEVCGLEERFHRAWLSLRQSQEKLRRSANSVEHQLLGDVPADAFADVGPAIDLSARSWPRFRSTREARSEAARLSAAVLALEGRDVQLVEALRTVAAPDEILNRKLILALWSRVQELEQKQVPTATNIPARARAEAAIAAHPEKSDRVIADELGIGKDTVRRARNLLALHAPPTRRKV
jgi:hypothetical protein